MRFKKGTMVEVFCQTENPVGCWRCAEIVKEYGHNFVVKYYSGMNKGPNEERVHGKFIRPFPLKLEFLENWNSGDVIEVLHNFTWKMATVSKVLSRGKFLVRLVGFVGEFEVNKFHMRLRQSWVNDIWVVIGKSGMNNDNKRGLKESLEHNQMSGSQISRPSSKISLQKKPGQVMYEKNVNLRSSDKPSTRILKRKSRDYLSKAEDCGRKFKVNEKSGSCYPVYFENVPQMPGKVKTNTYHRDVPGENILPLFPNGRMRSLTGTNQARTEGDDVGCLPSVSSDRYDNDDDTCSSSCSSVWSNNPFNWPRTIEVNLVKNEKGDCSDAESVCWSYNEEPSSTSTKEEIGAEIRRLELHAYRCILVALHASGPLSWEKESLLTNLRISLHISNDEHLMELRTLISNSRNSCY